VTSTGRIAMSDEEKLALDYAFFKASDGQMTPFFSDNSIQQLELIDRQAKIRTGGFSISDDTKGEPEPRGRLDETGTSTVSTERLRAEDKLEELQRREVATGRRDRAGTAEARAEIMSAVTEDLDVLTQGVQAKFNTAVDEFSGGRLTEDRIEDLRVARDRLESAVPEGVSGPSTALIERIDGFIDRAGDTFGKPDPLRETTAPPGVSVPGIGVRTTGTEETVAEVNIELANNSGGHSKDEWLQAADYLERLGDERAAATAAAIRRKVE